ncbi:MAG TPA: ABC transporter permease, partial [Acetobacteraceae bacterium]|nr:ABC transporter permease [Acetobacteraceae bacterium]
SLLRTRRWTLVAGTVLFATILASQILAPWIAPQSPSAQRLLGRLADPSWHHLLGTDHLGRDVFSRLLFGGRFSLLVAAATLALSAVLGTAAGILSARIGGVLDEFLMRVVDLLISFPDVVVAIFLIAIVGQGYGTLIVALTIVGWTPFARLARGLTLGVNAREFVAAAEVLGCRPRFIMTRHILPNILRPIAAMGFLRFGHKLITVGGLSFLGLGVRPPTPDWALMLAESQSYVERAPLLMLAPGAMIFLSALAVTWIGQGLEPRSMAGGRIGG